VAVWPPEENQAMKLQLFAPFLTYPDTSSDFVSGGAVSLAAAIDGELHALAVNADIPDVSNALSRILLDTPEMIRKAKALSRNRATYLLGLFRDRAEAAGVAVTTTEITALPELMAAAAARHARYFDVSLVGWETGNATARQTAEAVIFGSGRPTVLLPVETTFADIDHVAIAWDGSRVAARAVADARFLLERAKRVSVLTVLDEKPLEDEDAGDRLAAALVRQGIAAEALRIHAQDCPIGETLQRSATERGCDILVMGGYGHSRLRDFVLGGATQGVLEALLLPVLLSH
jgi:nucleotide-binding universal stress UspA family protein